MVATFVKQIIDKALAASLTLDDIYRVWDEDWGKLNSFYDIVFEDLIDAIEHSPGKWFSDEIDYDKWLLSEAYRILMIYLDLLNYIDELSVLQLMKRRRDQIWK